MSTPARFGLQRPRHGKWIAGVCAALADRFNVRVTFVRIVFIVFGITGVGELVYLALWVLVPKQPQAVGTVRIPRR